MKWSNSATVLVILLMILGALLLRQVEYRRYSEEEVEDAMATLCDEYALLQGRHASDEEWRDFARKASEITEPIVADMETPNLPPSLLHEFVRYQFPQAIVGKGRVPATALAQLVAGVKQRREEQLVQQMNLRREQEASSGAGYRPLTVASHIVDTALALFLGCIFLATLKSWFFGRFDNPEDVLRRLGTRRNRELTT